VLLDIEGTTTPIAFVYDVLFPYARAHLREHLASQGSVGDTAKAVAMLRGEREAELKSAQRAPAAGGEGSRSRGPVQRGDTDIATYAEQLMAQDRKSPGLKLLQGEIWRFGYRTGELRGDVFPDVPPALQRWRRQGRDVAIYSSGSVLAQRLIFSTTQHGDLTSRLAGYFDTAMGPKQSPESYVRIAEAMEMEAGRLLFISDVATELQAARDAGCSVAMCVRPGNPVQQRLAGVPVITTFDDVGVDAAA